MPDQLNENPEIESLDKVLFHIQKEITLNGDYKIHLFLDNIDIEGNKKIIKYGECSVSKDVYNYLNSPIVEFVLSVNNFGATQFQPLRITENNKTSPIEEVNEIRNSIPISYKSWDKLFEENRIEYNLESQNEKMIFLRFSIGDKIKSDKYYDPNSDLEIASINFKKNIEIIDKKGKVIKLEDFSTILNTPESPLLKNKITLIKNDIVGVVNQSMDNTYLYVGEVENNFENDDNSFINLKNVISFKNTKKMKKVKTFNIKNCYHITGEKAFLYSKLKRRLMLPECGTADNYIEKLRIGDIIFHTSDDFTGKYKILNILDESVEAYDIKNPLLIYKIDYENFYLQRDPDSKFVYTDSNIPSSPDYPAEMSTSSSKKTSSSSPKKVISKPPEVVYWHYPKGADGEYTALYTPNSPPYAPTSPPYASTSPPYTTSSPPYAPTSPPYETSSPPYAPRSPSETPPRTPNIYDELEIYSGDPIILGWRFESGGGMTGSDDVYRSLILDSSGRPTSSWWIEDNEDRGPNIHPNGWRDDDLFYDNGEPIPHLEIVNELTKNEVPNNWKIALDIVKSRPIVRLPPIPERPKRDFTWKNFSSENDTNTSFTKKPHSYYDTLQEGQLVIIQGNSYVDQQHKYINLVGVVTFDSGEYAFIKPDYEKLDQSRKLELEKDMKDGSLKVEKKYLKKIKEIPINRYWESKISSFSRKCIKITNAENRFFNGRYNLINHLKDDEEMILLDHYTNYPLFENEKLNPIYQSNKNGFINRGPIVEDKRFWFICSASKDSDRIRTFYFTYARDFSSELTPPLGNNIWYCGKGERKGKDIIVKPEDIEYNIDYFDVSSIHMSVSKFLPSTINEIKGKEICINCKCEGHSFNLCPKPPERHMGACVNCGEFGHWKKDCPKYQQKKTLKKIHSHNSSSSDEKKTLKQKIESPKEKKKIKLSASKLALLRKHKQTKKKN